MRCTIHAIPQRAMHGRGGGSGGSVAPHGTQLSREARALLYTPANNNTNTAKGQALSHPYDDGGGVDVDDDCAVGCGARWRTYATENELRCKSSGKDSTCEIDQFGADCAFSFNVHFATKMVAFALRSIRLQTNRSGNPTHAVHASTLIVCGRPYDRKSLLCTWTITRARNHHA